MVDEAPRRRVAQAERHVERLDRQARFEMAGQRPSDDPAREGVEDNRQINEGLGEAHVSDVGDPYLIETRGLEAARQIGRDVEPMPTHRRLRDERAPAKGKQIVLVRQAQHPLGVDQEALTPELMGDAAIAVMAIVERDALDEVAQVGVVAFRRLGREMAIISGARHGAQRRWMLASSLRKPCGSAAVIFSMTA